MSQLTTSESELITQLKQKDPKSFELLYDRYADALYGVTLSIVRHKEVAEEVLQDGFLRIWNNIDQYASEKGRLFTWMVNIIRHLAIDKLRSKDFKNQSKTEGLVFSVYENEPDQNDLTEGIGATDLLTKIDKDQRLILELVYFKGYTQSEISKEYDIPLGTVKTRLRNGIKQLRNYIGLK